MLLEISLFGIVMDLRRDISVEEEEEDEEEEFEDYDSEDNTNEQCFDSTSTDDEVNF